MLNNDWYLTSNDELNQIRKEAIEERENYTAEVKLDLIRQLLAISLDTDATPADVLTTMEFIV